MKNVYSLLILSLSFFQIHAQTASAVIFAEAGEKFTLLLNGEVQNATPQANVKLTNLTGEFYQARVDFEDKTLADITNNNFVVKKGIEVTYMIKKNKKGEYVLRYHSETEPGMSTSSAAPMQETKRIADVDDAPAAQVQSADIETTETESTDVVSGEDMNVGVGTTVTQTTTTTKVKPTPTGEKVAVGMNIGGINMGVNVNVQDSGMNTDMNVEENSSVTTTTTSKTTTNSTVGKPVQTTKPVQSAAKPAVTTSRPVQKPVETISQGGCASSMTSASFSAAKSNIESKGFEESKLTIAKQVTKANCLTATQIKEVMALFGFEETKLDYAKFAYDYCFNQGEYYIVNDGFSFESSIEDLDKYLQSK